MLTPGKNSLKFKLNRRNSIPILVICLLFLNSLTSAQSTTSKDSVSASAIKSDSIKPVDTFRISKDKIEYKVSYQAKDSIEYNARAKILILHTEAEISYDNDKINADSISYEQDSSVLHAFKLPKPEGDTSYRSRITQGSETSTFSTLHFNFKSKRALIENAYSQYGDGFIMSEQVKRNSDNSISGLRNVYTTCNQEHPHFGIYAKKIKIIPNKVAVTGSANLVIEDIPTPLYLPFGMFPLKQGQRSGFKLPTYDKSESLGFGIRGGGYYFAISDHLDLLTEADIYAGGTWRVGFKSDYIYRYRFNGGINFSYAYNKIGESFEPGNSSNRNFQLQWMHAVNPNVLSGGNFSSNVTLGSSSYQRNNSYDAAAYLNNTYTSNITYSKTWQGKPFNFSAALRHNQNTSTHEVNVTLPEISFSVNQIFPLQFRKDIIKPRWYEKIGINYTMSALNSIHFYDTNFSISNLHFTDFQNGMRHSIPISASYNVLKYFNATFAANYNEYWYTKKEFKSYNFSDSKLDTNQTHGFYSARDVDFSSSLSTRIYGIKLFKHGAIKGIRHVLSPSITASYRPNLGSQYYYNTFLDSNYTKSHLSYFDAIVGLPTEGKFGGFSFALGNTLQMKVRSKKDTVSGTRKINLIDGLDLRASYNLAVDSFRWSRVAIGYRTTLFETLQMSAAASYSPYSIYKETGKDKPVSYYSEYGKLLKFESANLTLAASLPFKKKNTAMNHANEEQTKVIGKNYDSYVDFNVPWTMNLNYGVTLRKSFLVASQKDTLVLAQDVNFYGDVTLTPKWKVGYRSGYDFKLKKLSYTEFNIYRDLHCWEMKLGLIPFGLRKSYNFTLNVKSSVLQDLKLVRRKDFRDNL